MTPRIHKLGYFSSPDRGLDICLKLWPKVREKYPDAELHIFYGWDTFDSAFADNPERQGWKNKILELCKQPGIIQHGRVGKKALSEWQKNIGIWMYPTHFTEINCITALDCQSHGCVPVTMSLAALDETVQSGVKLTCDIHDQECEDLYVKELLDLMGNEEKWQEEQVKGTEFVKGYDWETIAKQWEAVL